MVFSLKPVFLLSIALASTLATTAPKRLRSDDDDTTEKHASAQAGAGEGSSSKKHAADEEHKPPTDHYTSSWPEYILHDPLTQSDRNTLLQQTLLAPFAKKKISRAEHAAIFARGLVPPLIKENEAGTDELYTELGVFHPCMEGTVLRALRECMIDESASLEEKREKLNAQILEIDNARKALGSYIETMSGAPSKKDREDAAKRGTALCRRIFEGDKDFKSFKAYFPAFDARTRELHATLMRLQETS